ncbi:hypothetical protein C0Q70_09762 [Pomacea canaliculata]|uniref:Uncharacterized protein n=1 Tax=Pomacea canaliculata TaxID=400727 RepID=A0A2T7PAP2_POMCA|nr:hypothetical protein C0Q70_09762 [Pomacea canaliculata]
MRQADTNQESLAVVTLTTDAAEVQATVLPVRWRGNGAPPQQLTEAVQSVAKTKNIKENEEYKIFAKNDWLWRKRTVFCSRAEINEATLRKGRRNRESEVQLQRQLLYEGSASEKQDFDNSPRASHGLAGEWRRKRVISLVCWRTNNDLHKGTSRG